MAAKKKTSKSSAPATMEELLAKTGYSLQTFRRGDKIKARFVEAGSRSAVFDIGGKSEGIITDSAFDDAKSFILNLEPGQEIVAMVYDPETPDGNVRLSLRHTASEAVWKKLEEAKNADKAVSVLGKEVTGAGVLVGFEALEGFIPNSQLGKKVKKDPQSLMDKRFEVKVIELDKQRKGVVFSEKAVSEAEEIKRAKQGIKELSEGDILEATVRDIVDFGVFVELETTVNKKKTKVEGLVHISELAWDKISSPREVVKEGDEIKVMVIGKEGGKLALSLKQAQKDPWEEAGEKYEKDAKVKGKIIRRSDFGLFVQLEPGIEGLIHITKIPPTTKLTIGQEVDCYVEDIDPRQRKISLGLVLTAKPVGYK